MLSFLWHKSAYLTSPAKPLSCVESLQTETMSPAHSEGIHWQEQDSIRHLVAFPVGLKDISLFHYAQTFRNVSKSRSSLYPQFYFSREFHQIFVVYVSKNPSYEMSMPSTNKLTGYSHYDLIYLFKSIGDIPIWTKIRKTYP